MSNFDSNLGGQTRGWVGQSWEAKCPPLHPTGMYFLLSLPAPGMGSKDGWGRQLCPDRYPRGRPELTAPGIAPSWVAEWKIPLMLGSL